MLSFIKTYCLCTCLLVAQINLLTAEEIQPASEVITQDSIRSSLKATGNYRFVYRMFFKLYDASFYTDAAKTEDVGELLSGKYVLHLEFDYLRKIKKSIVLESSEKILAKNMSAEQLGSIQERVDRINAAYRTVYKGDRSALSYLPGFGTTLWINGEPVITIEGEDFARLYFRIWFGEQPISVQMRNALLRRV